MINDFIEAYPAKSIRHDSFMLLNRNFIKSIEVFAETEEEGDRWIVYFHTENETYVHYKSYKSEDDALDMIYDFIGRGEESNGNY